MKKLIITLLFVPILAKAEVGVASWYGKENSRGSTGKKLEPHLPRAAHKKLPIGSKVKVTDLKTNKSVVVVIEDRGPYIKGRVIDLNLCAAKQLDLINRGLTKVKLELVGS
jgi:rare lipoprotein A